MGNFSVIADLLPSGSLRDIDRLASAALREAARKKRKVVDLEAVDKAIAAEGGA